jgi:hypothetical protein
MSGNKQADWLIARGWRKKGYAWWSKGDGLGVRVDEAVRREKDAEERTMQDKVQCAQDAVKRLGETFAEITAKREAAYISVTREAEQAIPAVPITAARFLQIANDVRDGIARLESAVRRSCGDDIFEVTAIFRTLRRPT